MYLIFRKEYLTWPSVKYTQKNVELQTDAEPVNTSVSETWDNITLPLSGNSVILLRHPLGDKILIKF